MEAPLGHSAAVDQEDIAIAQRIIKFRLDSERLNSYFINYYFQTDIFQKLLIRTRYWVNSFRYQKPVN